MSPTQTPRPRPVPPGGIPLQRPQPGRLVVPLSAAAVVWLAVMVTLVVLLLSGPRP